MSFLSPIFPTSILWYVTQGRIVVKIKDVVHEIGPGEAFLAATGVQRHISTPDGAEWLSLMFRAELFSHFDILRALNPPIKWKPDAGDEQLMRTWMWQAIEAWFGSADPPREDALKITGHSHPPSSVENELMANSLAGAVAALVVRHHARRGRLPAGMLTPPSWLVKAMDHLRQTPTTTVDEWAKVVAYSPSRFRTLFQQATACSPRDYLQQYRIERAQRLLATTELTVDSIATELGFESLSHFSQLFAARTGTTPARYRKSVRAEFAKALIEP